MNFSNQKLINAIKRYRQDEIGLHWDLFWEYKNRAEHVGGSILSVRNITQTVRYLYIYLNGFGMSRNTGLNDANVISFTKMLCKIRPVYDDIRFITYDNISANDCAAIDFFIKKLSSSLESAEISSSCTMITKILMVIWGQCPALDRYFKLAFPFDYNSWSWHYLSKSANISNFISFLKKHNERWIDLRKNLSKIDRLSRFSDKIEIPIPRLIDMAYWQIGYTKTQNSDI